MMKKMMFSLILACAASVYAAPNLPAEVRKELAEAEQMCREHENGKLDFSKGVSIVDLNNDGISDYIVDYNGLYCDTAASLFAGNSGAVYFIYTGLPNGKARLAYTGSSYELRLDRRGATARLYETTAGGNCGQDMRHVTTAELEFCVRELKWNAAKQRFYLDKKIIKL